MSPACAIINGMERRDEIERKVWRRAFALTGDPEGAEAVLVAVWRINPDVARIGESRLDRLIAAKSREHVARRGFARALRAGAGGAIPAAAGGAGEKDDRAARLIQAVADLSSPLREAWIMRDVIGMKELDVAQALGAPRETVERHRTLAEETLSLRLEENYHGAIIAWRAIIGAHGGGLALDAARTKLARVVARKRLIALLQFIILIAAMGAMVYVGLDLLGWSERESEQEQLQDLYSVPIPGGGSSGASP